MSHSAETADAALNLSPRAKLEILGAILLAMFLFALDQTVVGIALPRIITDLNGNELYTWVVTVYLLTSTISGPIYGKLSDLFGRRPIIIFAVGLFLVASVLCGLSQEMWQFILFRGLQGLGGGAVFPVALAVIADLYTPAERGKYLGLFGAVFGLSSLVGPAHRRAHHRHVRLALDLLRQRADRPRSRSVILWRLLPAIKRPEAARNIDYLGAAVFTARDRPVPGRPDEQGRPADWTDPGGRRPDRCSASSSGPSSCGSSRASPSRSCRSACSGSATFTISVAAMFLAAFGFFGAVVFLPRWFQVVGRRERHRVGLQPPAARSAALIVSAIVSGQIVARTGRYKMLISARWSLLAVGPVPDDQPPRRHRPARSCGSGWSSPGSGIGPSFAVFTLVVQNAVSPRRIGVATSSLTFFQQIGGTVGPDDRRHDLRRPARSTEIPTQLVAAGVPAAGGRPVRRRGRPARPDRDGRPRRSGSWPACRRQQAFVAAADRRRSSQGIHEAFSIAIASTFWVGIAGAIIAAVLVAFLNEVPMRTTFEGGSSLEG